MSMMLVFDIGATKTRMALVEDGVLQEVTVGETDATAAGMGAFVDQVRELGRGRGVEAVVGGIPGQLSEGGVIARLNNIRGWVNFAIVDQITEALGCPVYITNDVILGGLGEAHDGAGTDQGVMAYVTISTGVNAVRLVDGVVD